MLLSTININRLGWPKIRLIFNAIDCSNFGTIPAVGTWPNCSNMLALKYCGCIHSIPSSHLQLRHFNQTAAISSRTKILIKAAAATGNEQQPKPSESFWMYSQDAYKVVAAVDWLICHLPPEAPAIPEGNEKPLVLATQIVPGGRHDCELLAWHKKEGQWHFGIRSVRMSEDHYFQFRVLAQVRQKMARMLMEQDGTRWIDEMPTIPEWATRDAPDSEQQEKQPSVKQEQMTEKKADADADEHEDCPGST